MSSTAKLIANWSSTASGTKPQLASLNKLIYGGKASLRGRQLIAEIAKMADDTGWFSDVFLSDLLSEGQVEDSVARKFLPRALPATSQLRMHNLPPLPTAPFVRQDLLERLYKTSTVAALDHEDVKCRVVIVSGKEGSGKTTLLHQFAHYCIKNEYSRFDAVVYVAPRLVHGDRKLPIEVTLDDVLLSVADVIGCSDLRYTEDYVTAIQDRFNKFIPGKKMLVVLDAFPPRGRTYDTARRRIADWLSRLPANCAAVVACNDDIEQNLFPDALRISAETLTNSDVRQLLQWQRKIGIPTKFQSPDSHRKLTIALTNMTMKEAIAVCAELRRTPNAHLDSILALARNNKLPGLLTKSWTALPQQAKRIIHMLSMLPGSVSLDGIATLLDSDETLARTLLQDLVATPFVSEIAIAQKQLRYTIDTAARKFLNSSGEDGIAIPEFISHCTDIYADWLNTDVDVEWTDHDSFEIARADAINLEYLLTVIKPLADKSRSYSSLYIKCVLAMRQYWDTCNSHQTRLNRLEAALALAERHQLKQERVRLLAILIRAYCNDDQLEKAKLQEKLLHALTRDLELPGELRASVEWAKLTLKRRENGSSEVLREARQLWTKYSQENPAMPDWVAKFAYTYCKTASQVAALPNEMRQEVVDILEQLRRQSPESMPLRYRVATLIVFASMLSNTNAQRADGYLAEAETIASKLSYFYRLAEIRIARSDLAYRRGDLDSAQTWLKAAQAVAEQSGRHGVQNDVKILAKKLHAEAAKLT